MDQYGQGRSRFWYWRQILAAITVGLFREVWRQKVRTLLAVGTGLIMCAPYRSAFDRPCVGNQFLRFRQIIAVFNRFVFQPLESIKFEITLLYFADVEFPPAVFLRIGSLTFCSAIRIFAITFLELGEVSRRQWSVLFGYSRNVRSSVVDPNVFRGVPFVKNRTSAFTPWLYGVNVPRGRRHPWRPHRFCPVTESASRTPR